MHMVFEEDDSFTIFFMKNIYDQDKTETMKNIKEFLLTYNQYYHFLKAGFYQVEVGFHEKIGTILKISFLDDFDSGDHNIDMKIIFVGRQKIILELEEIPFGIEDFYLYQGKFYLLEEELTKKKFFRVLEHSKILYGEKVAKLKRYLKKCHLKKDQVF